jgi:signal transduction histidine kinase
VLERAPVDLGALLEQSVEENRSFAASRNLRLVVAGVDDGAFVVGDAFALRQIIDNLMSNAIKFSNEHDVIEGTVRITDGRVRLSVRDRGRGIPPGKEAEVFGRFGQVANSGQGSTQGSGLGLHISRQLAGKMSGRVYYESELGAGATFHLELAATDLRAERPTQLAG